MALYAPARGQPLPPLEPEAVSISLAPRPSPAAEASAEPGPALGALFDQLAAAQPSATEATESPAQTTSLDDLFGPAAGGPLPGAKAELDPWARASLGARTAEGQGRADAIAAQTHRCLSDPLPAAVRLVVVVDGKGRITAPPRPLRGSSRPPSGPAGVAERVAIRALMACSPFNLGPAAGARALEVEFAARPH